MIEEKIIEEFTKWLSSGLNDRFSGSLRNCLALDFLNEKYMSELGVDLSFMNFSLEKIKVNEKVKLKPYRCTSDKLTIGIGRNIEDNGISLDESIFMAENDIVSAIKELNYSFEWFKESHETVKYVLVDMLFNMGLPKLKGFKKTLNLLKNKRYESAADEMLDSKWASQVGDRAVRLSEALRMIRLF